MKRYVFASQPWTFPEKRGAPLELWTACLLHRQFISHMICSCGESGRLAVYGSLVCFELDLTRISDKFESITLFSAQRDITEKAIKHQKMEHPDRVQVVSLEDYSGLGPLGDMLPTETTYESAMQSILEFKLPPRTEPDSKGFDLVVSSCLLNPIIHQVEHLLQKKDETAAKLIKNLRDKHIVELLRNCRKGGKVQLMFDFVSSKTLPELENATADNIQEMLNDALAKNNYFHGSHPASMKLAIENEPELNELVESHRFTKPWIWDTLDLKRAAMAIELTRK